ncbi:MAG: phosphoglycerate dehydrogenase [Proteobacteria bacterium]|nr:phosphoglycerate dehydrogenase [Pseudomonadota bacterium]
MNLDDEPFSVGGGFADDDKSNRSNRTFRVLVSDKLDKRGVKLLEEEPGITVDVKTGMTPEEFLSVIRDYDALIIRSATKVTARALERAERLMVVGRAGIGLDNVDIPAATQKGVAVMNTPKGNVVTTAEHAISMMMSMSRNISRATASMKAGKWEKKLFQGREIMNKNLGVIGFGKIGSVVADRARGMKMNVLVFDPVVPNDRIQKAGFTACDLPELFEKADYITVHVPRTKKTLSLLNKAAFDRMKDGVMIVNCARGGIVNENDLHDAIVSGKVAGAALDVFENEPPGDHPLLSLEQVTATPHLGASTLEAQRNVALQVAEQIIMYLKSNTAVNTVNVPQVTGKLLEKLSPFLSLGEKMGTLLAQLVSGHIHDVTVEYNGDLDDLDTSPVTTSIVKGLLTPLASDPVNFVNAPVMAEDMGISITEKKSKDAWDYTNLIRVKVETDQGEWSVAGTLFGKNYPRIVAIGRMRLEMVPEGYFTLLEGENEPGSIGAIGHTLGSLSINISRMTVGQHVDNTQNKIFLRTDIPLPDEARDALLRLPLVSELQSFEL